MIRAIGRRAGLRAVAVLGMAGALVVLVAAPASAHAELLRSSPAPGAVLATAPDQVRLSFTENVDVETGGVRVFDADANRVDEGGVQSSGRTVTLPLPSLDDGSYVVTWRATSADSHPVSGAFTFQVGQAGASATSQEVQGLANRLLAEQGGDRLVGVLFGAARFLVFAGLALFIGGMFFAVVIWPPARRSVAARRVVLAGWLGVTIATLGGLLLYGPYVEGLGIGDVFSTSLLGDSLGVRFGQIWLARLLMLLVMAPLAAWVFRRDATTGEAHSLPSWWASVMVVLGIVLASTPGLAGHATTGDWATSAVVADTIHVLTMAIWLGGLVVLAVVTLARHVGIEARDAVERFSRTAFVCVLALVATGAFQTWRQVGSLDALRGTDYGRILVVKLVLVALVIVFAAFSREVVLRLLPISDEPHSGLPVVAGGSDDDDGDTDDEYEVDEAAELRRLRWSVWAEIATAVLILAATALLVNAAPAKTALAAPGKGGVAGVTLHSKNVNVDVTLTPAVAGDNDVHVDTSDSDGAPKNVKDLTVTMALPGRGIAPIDVPLRRLGPGHYLSPGFQIPLSGNWRVTAKPLLSEFEEPTLRGTVEVG